MASSATTPGATVRVRLFLCACATPAAPLTQAKDCKPHRSAQESITHWPWAATDTPTHGDNEYGQLGNNSTNNSTIPALVRDPADPTNTSQGLKAVQVSTGYSHSLAVGTDGGNTAWGDNQYGQLGNDGIPTGENNSKAKSPVPAPVVLNPQPVITSVRFDQTPLSGLRRGDDGSVNALTPAHQPGTVTVSVDYTLGGAHQTPDTSLQYTYTPATPTGVLPRAGGEGILLALTTGMTGMGGVLASRRHRKEQHQLSHASHE